MQHSSLGRGIQRDLGNGYRIDLRQLIVGRQHLGVHSRLHELDACNFLLGVLDRTIDAGRQGVRSGEVFLSVRRDCHRIPPVHHRRLDTLEQIAAGDQKRAPLRASPTYGSSMIWSGAASGAPLITDEHAELCLGIRPGLAACWPAERLPEWRARPHPATAAPTLPFAATKTCAARRHAKYSTTTL